MMEDRNIIAVEIGSSAIKGAFATVSPAGVLTVHSIEEESFVDWVRYGAVRNVEEVATLVGRIIRKLENRISPRKVSAVHVALGGRSFGAVTRTASRTFMEEVEIGDDLISQLMAEVSATPVPEREILTVIPREYIVDNTKVSTPKGTVGRSLKLVANLIVCRQQSKRNIERLFADKLKMQIAGCHVRQIAIANAVLTSDERRLGCMLVDFGAETTDVSIYKDNALRYFATLPIGSRNITRDITSLNILEETAEKLKCTQANALPASKDSRASFDFNVDFSEINNLVTHRAGEIIANIRQQLKYASLKSTDLPAGIVVTGRGARLAGFNERLQQSLSMNVRTANIVLPNMRLADSRISPTDAVDILSLIYSAASVAGPDCLTKAPAVDPQPEPEPEPVVVEPEVSVEIEQPTKKKSKYKYKWYERLKDTVSGLMIEAEDLRDDED